MKMNNKKKLDYYLDLPWTYTIETTKEDGKILYVVSVNELPGICTDAFTLDNAMMLIKEAMTAAFQLYLENGEEIPEPINKDQFKGNIAYRTNSKRHYLIARAAQKKASSLSKVIDECVDIALRKR